MEHEVGRQEAYAGFLDFYRRGPYAAHVQAVRHPAGAPVSLVRFRQPAGRYPDPALPEFSLQFNPASTSFASEWDVGGGRRRGRLPPGHFSCAPPDTACDYRVFEAFDLLAVNVPAADAARLLDPIVPIVPGGFRGDFGALHGPLVDDPFVAGLAERMWAEAADDCPRGRLFLDGAVLALLAALLGRSRGEAAPPPPARGGLAPWRLKRALELVEARLGDDLSLGDLAAAAGLHPVHFVRAFRASTGATPHRHLLARRIERAKGLLAGTALPIAEVALACGFASQSHLGAWFRRLAGTSPKRYREEARG